MIPHDSNKWRELNSSTGGDGTLSSKLIVGLRNGELINLQELHHQACHQLSIGSVAFAIVPHLTDIMENCNNETVINILEIIGVVKACEKKNSHRIPDELKMEYEKACDKAHAKALYILTNRSYNKGQFKKVMAFVAAINGDINLSIHLYLHGGSEGDLHCPNCGEYIKW